MTFWALRAGVFTGGGGLMNQLIGQAGTGEASRIDLLKSPFNHEEGFVGAVAMPKMGVRNK